MVQKYFQDIEQKELRAEKEEGMRLKRIASQMAKMVKEFWSNIEKVIPGSDPMFYALNNINKFSINIYNFFPIIIK